MDKRIKSLDNDDILEIPCLCSQRWVLGYIGFLFGAVFAVFRMDINIAIVCMAGDVKDNVTHYVNSSTIEIAFNGSNELGWSVCDVEANQADSDITPEFTWDRGTQSHILSAYYYGFVVAQVPFSWFIGHFGGKTVVSVFVGVASLATLLIPVLARAHFYGVMSARIVVGMASAPLPAAWMSLVGKWALANERSRMMMVFWLGQTFGSSLGFFTSGYLCAYGFDNGWASIFYSHGICGCVFIVLWMYFTADSPENHPRISEAEKRILSKYIHVNTANRGQFFSVPWKTVLTSVNVWAIFLTQLCDNTIYYLIVICLPLFIKEILRFDIKSNGVYSALPSVTTAASCVTAAMLADYINSKRLVSRTTNRKIFQITSFLVSTTFLVLSSFMACDQRHIVILLFCICTFFQSMALSAAFPCNLVDMTPRYASFIYSVSNTIGGTSGIMVPLAVAYLTQHKTIYEWRNVFWITAGIAVLGSIVYGLFSTSEPMSWDQPTSLELEINPEEKTTFITDLNGLASKQNISAHKVEVVLQNNGINEKKSIVSVLNDHEGIDR